MIPASWKAYSLREVCYKITDGSHYSPKDSIYGNRMIATVKDMNEYGFDIINCKRISEEDYQEIVKNGCKPEKGDILFSKDGTMGIVQYFKEDIDIVLLSSIAILKPNIEKINGRFLAYCLKNPYTNKFIKDNFQSGSALPRIVLKDLKKLKLTIPDNVSEQFRIASILSSLDDKIEINLQMNKTLEAIAQAIFKGWFVEFRFPGFDGELVDGLPRGWKIGKVSDTCKVNANTLSYKDEIDEIKYIEISEVERGIIKNITIYKRGEEPSRAKRKLVHGDIALSTVRPNRGSYFLAFHPENNLIASTGFAVFTPISVPYSFLYSFLSAEEQIEYYGRMADGAAYPAINPSVIMNIDLTIPSEEVLKLFDATVVNLYSKIYENLKENQTLIRLRDIILPKLMTGKIRVA